jgi:hypothetical protein
VRERSHRPVDRRLALTYGGCGGTVGRRGAGAHDAAALDRRVDIQHRHVLALEAFGASPAVLAAVQLLDVIVAERNALVRSELGASLLPPPAAGHRHSPAMRRC